MLTCPFGLNCELGPNSWMAVQIVAQHAGNLNSRGKQRSVKDNTSLSTRMGPGGNLWLRLGCLRDLLRLGAYRQAPQRSRGRGQGQAQPRLQNRAWSSAYTLTRRRL